MIDSNHDIVPTLRMFDGLVMGHAADEIERLRKELAALRAQSVQPDAYIGVKKAAQILQDRKAGIPPTPAQQVQLTGDRMAYESMCEPSIAQPAPAARAQMTEDQIINLVIKCEKAPEHLS